MVQNKTEKLQHSVFHNRYRNYIVTIELDENNCKTYTSMEYQTEAFCNLAIQNLINIISTRNARRKSFDQDGQY